MALVPDPASVDAEDSMTRSDYALVVFTNISENYVPNTPIECHYTISNTLTYSTSDWIGLYRVGWSSPKEYTSFVWAKVENAEKMPLEGIIVFPANKLPREDGEFYQFCYVTSSNQIRGASIPFQFKQPILDEYVEQMDEENDMMVIKSRSLALEDDLTKAQNDKADLLKTRNLLQEERDSLLEKIVHLNGDNDGLKRDLKHWESVCKECHVKNDALQQEMNEVTGKSDDLKEKLAVMKQEIDEVGKRLEENERYISSLQEEIKNLVSEKDALIGRNRQLEEEKDLLKGNSSSNETVALVCEQKAAALQMQLQELKEEEALQRERVQQLGIALNEKQTLLQTQTLLTEKSMAEKIEIEGRLRDAEERLQVTEECKNRLTQDIEAHQQTHEQMSGDLEKSKTEAYNVKQQLIKMEKDYKNAQDARQRETEGLSANLQEVCKKNGDLQQQLALVTDMTTRIEKQNKEEEEGALYALRFAHRHLNDKFMQKEKLHDELKKHGDELLAKQRFMEEKQKALECEVEDLNERLRLAADENKSIKTECELLRKKLTGEKATASSSSLPNVEAQVCSLASDIDDLRLKKQSYKAKYKQENEKNKYMQKHYHEELRKRDELVEQLNKQLEEKQNEHDSCQREMQSRIDEQIIRSMPSNSLANFSYSDGPGSMVVVNRNPMEMRYRNPYTSNSIPEVELSSASSSLEPLQPIITPELLPSADNADVRAASLELLSMEEQLNPVGEEGRIHAPEIAITPAAEEETEQFHDAQGQLSSCPYCQMEFNHDPQEYIDQHLAQHTTSPLNNLCPMCGATYEEDRPEDFRAHVNTHFPD